VILESAKHYSHGEPEASNSRLLMRHANQYGWFEGTSNGLPANEKLLLILDVPENIARAIEEKKGNEEGLTDIASRTEIPGEYKFRTRVYLARPLGERSLRLSLEPLDDGIVREIPPIISSASRHLASNTALW
jgi:hypothetical protein